MNELMLNNGNFLTIDDIDERVLKTGCFSVTNDNKKIDCFYKPYEKKSSNYLVICLSGARNPSKNILPHFNRWSWSELFEADLLCISDPSYYLDQSSLNLAWYIGTKNFDCIKFLSELVKKVSELAGISLENIIVYGSSGGGFAALKLIDELNSGVAVAINPQTDIFKYYEPFYKKFIETCFSNMSGDDFADESIQNKFNVFSSKNKIINYKIIYAQNKVDIHHYRYHYLPYCRRYKLSEKGGEVNYIENIIYEHENGHGAETKEFAKYLIEKAKSKIISKCKISFNYEDVIFFSGHTNKRINEKQLELKPNTITEIVGPFDNEFQFFAHGRKDIPITNFNFPIKWNHNLYNDRNWLFQLNIWRIIDNNIKKFELEKNKEDLIFPKKIVLDWYREHFILNRNNPYTDGDMVVGGRAMRLAYLISQYQHGNLYLSEYELICFNDLVEFHLNFLLDEKNIAYSNHTLTDVQGMAALAQVVKGELKVNIENFLDKIMPKLLESQFNEECIHVENSPEYHPFGIKCLKNLNVTGWFDKYHLDDIISKAQKITDNFLLPDGRILPFGDSTALKQDFSISKIVYKNKDKIFNKAGYFIYRSSKNSSVSDSSFLAVMGALNSRFHKQSDDLSLHWFEGEDILCDVGKYAYKTNDFRAYAISTRAHNTIEINGDNYYLGNKIASEQIFGNAIQYYKEAEWGIEISSEIYRKSLVNHIDLNINHKRKVLFSPGKWLCVIDFLSSSKECEYKQWFHFSSQFGDLNCVNTYSFEGVSNKTKKRLNITCVTHIDESKCYFGQKEPFIQGWMGEGYANMVPSSALYFSKKGKKVHFVTLLSLGRENVKLSKKNDNRYILKSVDACLIIKIGSNSVIIESSC